MGDGSNAKAANDIDRHVGERLRAGRIAVGFSQEALARALGISFQQIQKYERGTNRISAGRLHEITKVLGLSIAWFYDPDTPRGSLPVRPTDPALSNEQGIALLKAFDGIQDPEARRRILSLVRTLGNSSKARPDADETPAAVPGPPPTVSVAKADRPKRAAR